MNTDVQEYVAADGRAPFSEWLGSLRDRQARARVRARLNRIRLGNFGDCKPVGGGVLELRMNFGPGYRVYFGRPDEETVLLLCGGEKRSQERDIKRAKVFWNEYQKKRRG